MSILENLDHFENLFTNGF